MNKNNLTESVTEAAGPNNEDNEDVITEKITLFFPAIASGASLWDRRKRPRRARKAT